MTETLANRVLYSLHAELRNTTLNSGERALFIARLVVWYLLPPQLKSGIVDLTGGDDVARPRAEALDVAWRNLSPREDLALAHYVFGEGLGPARRFLSDELLSRLQPTVWRLQSIAKTERLELAHELAQYLLRQTPGEVSLTSEVADFVVRLVNPRAGEKIFCPGPSSDALAIAAMQFGALPVVVSRMPPIAACVYALIADLPLEVYHSDPYENLDTYSGPSGVFDCGAVFPPMGAVPRPERRPDPRFFDTRSAPALGIGLGIETVKDRLAVIVPNSFLSSGGAERKFREVLLEAGYLTAVISFPPGLLINAWIACSILVLTLSHRVDTVVMCKVDETRHCTGQGKLKTRDRRLVGGTEVLKLLANPDNELARVVSYEQISAQDHVLVVDRYLSPPEELLGGLNRPMSPLGELVEIIKPQFLRTIEQEGGVEIQEATPGEMPEHGYLVSVPRTRYVDPQQLKLRKNQILRQGDIVLSTKGSIGTVGLAHPSPDSQVPLLPSQASVILRIRPDAEIVDPRYLVMYLRSPKVQAAMYSLASGSTIANISIGDLKVLPVWIAALEHQAELLRVFDEQGELQAEINTLRRQQIELSERAWRDAGLGSDDEVNDYRGA